MPTANPHTILPRRSSAWWEAVPIMIQPTMRGSVHVCSVRFRPIASMIGPDSIDPRGVAAEWILAVDKSLLLEYLCFIYSSIEKYILIGILMAILFNCSKICERVALYDTRRTRFEVTHHFWNRCGSTFQAVSLLNRVIWFGQSRSGVYYTVMLIMN